MTLGQIDYHLTKPWRRDKTLYPAVTEFLANWTAAHDAPTGGIFHIVGPRESPRALEIREGLPGLVPGRAQGLLEPVLLLLEGQELLKGQEDLLAGVGARQVDKTGAADIAGRCTLDEAIETGKRLAERTPAADMPGFQLADPVEIDQEAKYQARLETEHDMRRSIVDGHKTFEGDGGK